MQHLKSRLRSPFARLGEPAPPAPVLAGRSHARIARRVALAAMLVAFSALPLSATGPAQGAVAQAGGCALPPVAEPVMVLVIPAETPDPVVIAPAATDAAAPATVAGLTREAASPVAASPVASPVASPTAVDPLATLSAELTGVADALAACLTTGEGALVTDLATGRYLGQLYGDNNPLSAADYLALTEGVAPVPVRILSLSEVEPDGADRASAEVTSVVGNQLLRSRWSFALAPSDERDDDESRWQVDGESPLPPTPPANTSSIAVTLDDYTFTLDQTQVTASDVILQGRNESAQDHEMLVLRLNNNLTTTDLLRGTGPGLPAGIDYVGQTTVAAGDTADLVLVDLDPGTYTVVCYFLTADGVPHLALGMEATFTIAP